MLFGISLLFGIESLLDMFLSTHYDSQIDLKGSIVGNVADSLASPTKKGRPYILATSMQTIILLILGVSIRQTQITKFSTDYLKPGVSIIIHL